MDIEAREDELDQGAKISFLRDALYTHARQVSQFCQSGFNRVDSYTAERRTQQYEDFSLRATRLIDQLVHLIGCARNAPSLSSTLNLEQLEAKAEMLYSQLEEYALNNIDNNRESA